MLVFEFDACGAWKSCCLKLAPEKCDDVCWNIELLSRLFICEIEGKGSQRKVTVVNKGDYPKALFDA